MLLSRGRATKDFRVKLLDQGLYIQVCITDTAKKKYINLVYISHKY